MQKWWEICRGFPGAGCWCPSVGVFGASRCPKVGACKGSGLEREGRDVRVGMPRQHFSGSQRNRPRARRSRARGRSPGENKALLAKLPFQVGDSNECPGNVGWVNALMRFKQGCGPEWKLLPVTFEPLGLPRTASFKNPTLQCFTSRTVPFSKRTCRDCVKVVYKPEQLSVD